MSWYPYLYFIPIVLAGIVLQIALRVWLDPKAPFLGPYAAVALSAIAVLAVLSEVGLDLAHGGLTAVALMTFFAVHWRQTDPWTAAGVCRPLAAAAAIVALYAGMTNQLLPALAALGIIGFLIYLPQAARGP